MTTDAELHSLADGAPFIFTGSIARTGASTMSMLPVTANTVIVAVDDVVHAPEGFATFAGRDVTVLLREPLESGRFLFFADPWAVGGGIALKERAHVDATAKAVRDRVAAVREAGYVTWIAPHVEPAALVALGTIGTVTDLLDPKERPKGVAWAVAPLEIERVFKGDAELTGVLLVGPRYASRHLPKAPALRPGLHAIFILQQPPPDAPAVPNAPRSEPVLFIADTADIQPPERVPTFEQIVGDTREETTT